MPPIDLTMDVLFQAYLSGNYASTPYYGTLLASFASTGATQAEVARWVLHELKRNVGIGVVEDLVVFGTTDMEGIVAPLSFRNLSIQAPKCVSEQANGQPCN